MPTSRTPNVQYLGRLSAAKKIFAQRQACKEPGNINADIEKAIAADSNLSAVDMSEAKGPGGKSKRGN
jgi:hypothetical protein